MAKIFPESLPAPSLYRTMARNEGLFTDLIERRIIGRTGLLDRKTFPPRLRELLILRTCVAAKNDYEFNLHVRTISEVMGLTKAEIEDLKRDDIDVDSWPPPERALIALIDGLVHDLDVEEAIFDAARAHFSDEQLLELTLLVGLYTAVSMVVALARPERDPY
jgi:alkylhydroperoxidase family enzyme